MDNNKLIPKLRFREFDGEWESCKLHELCKVQDGTHSTPNYVEEGIPFFSVDTIINNVNPKYISKKDHEKLIKRCEPKKGDILLSRITGGILGYPKLVDWDFEFSIYVSLALLSSIKIDSKYLNYYIQSSVYRKDFLSKSLLTASPPKINLNDLESTNIKYPKFYEQKKIDNFFFLLNKKIDLLENKYQLYNNFKKYLMQQIFAGKLRFADNENWKTVKLGDVCKITMGQSPSSENYSENNFHTVLIQGNADIINGKVVPRVYTSEITKISKPGDIIMTVRAPVGDLAINEFESCIGRGVCSIEGNKFIYYLLQSLKDNHVWERLSQGSTFESINSNDIKNLKVKMPSEETQNTISLFLTEIDSKIELYEIQFLTFQKLKKGLLQQMFVCLWKLIKKLMKLKSDFITE